MFLDEGVSHHDNFGHRFSVQGFCAPVKGTLACSALTPSYESPVSEMQDIDTDTAFSTQVVRAKRLATGLWQPDSHRASESEVSCRTSVAKVCKQTLTVSLPYWQHTMATMRSFLVMYQ